MVKTDNQWLQNLSFEAKVIRYLLAALVGFELAKGIF